MLQLFVTEVVGISTVRKALDSRSVNVPSTDCVVEAVEICLRAKNCQFSGKGQKKRRGYADLLMCIIDEKAKFRGYLKPRLWWRYRVDVFGICIQGLPKLLQFTDNALCSTIEFELVYSDGHVHVLDLT